MRLGNLLPRKHHQELGQPDNFVIKRGCFEREESEMCVLCKYAGTVFISSQIGMSCHLVKNPRAREDLVGLPDRGP